MVYLKYQNDQNHHFEYELLCNFFLVKNNTCKEYNYHGLVLVLKKNNYEKFINYLHRNNIFAFIGYIPLHVSSYGKKFLKKGERLINTNKIYNKVVRLPLHTNLSKKDINFISIKIKKFFQLN